MKIEKQIIDYIQKNIDSQVESISIIGSYVLSRKLRNGSDIDVVVVVRDIANAIIKFDEIFYKQARKIIDSQGERIELNVKLDNLILDITIIDRFNKPNNPLLDHYENHIGWCKNALCIYGTPMKTLLDLDNKILLYEKIRLKRLSLVEEKIKITKSKILNQHRRDLHILYELQNYIFIREIIKQHIFNKQSIKHPEDSIPNFNQIYSDELKRDCGIIIEVKE